MLKKVKKFFISLCIIFLLFTSMPNSFVLALDGLGTAIESTANGETKGNGGIGGILLNPITNLFVGIGDAAVNLMQKYLLDGSRAITYRGLQTSLTGIDATLRIKYGPATIFSGNVPLFDINLLYSTEKPEDKYYLKERGPNTVESEDNSSGMGTGEEKNADFIEELKAKSYYFEDENGQTLECSTMSNEKIYTVYAIKTSELKDILKKYGYDEENADSLENLIPAEIDIGDYDSKADYIVGNWSIQAYDALQSETDIDYSKNKSFKYENKGPQGFWINKIFLTKEDDAIHECVWIKDKKINFFEYMDIHKQEGGTIAYTIIPYNKENNGTTIDLNNIEEYSYFVFGNTYTVTENIEYSDIKIPTAADFRNTLTKMYYILRNVVLVLFMSVLVYAGIKMVLSSASSQNKAKYKEMLKDWFIGLLLLFLLHFIMIGIIAISTKIVSVFSNFIVNNDGYDVLFTQIRKNVTESTSIKRMGYTIMYLVMILYTVMFTVQYIKRLLYIIFLTLAAPFVALTYPIDKMKDGQAQAFNTWFKEFLYNVIIQIIHIILYFVFIASAIDLAKDNMIYALVAIGFIMESEKLLKTMFGFSAQGGAFGGHSLLAGAVTMQTVRAIASKLGGNGPRGNKTKQHENNTQRNNIRTANRGNSLNSLLASMGATGSETINQQENQQEDQEAELPQEDQETELPQEEQNGRQEQNDPVLEKYKNDGYRQDANAYGLYFDPSRDDYFEDYDPHNDEKNYQQTEEQEQLQQLTQLDNSQEGEDIQTTQQRKTSQSKPKVITQTPQQDNTQEENIKQPGFLRRKYDGIREIANKPKVRGVMAVTGHYAGKVLKTGVKLYGAAGIGMVGVAAGLASDDFSNVFKYGAAGAGAGYLLGGKAFDVPSNIANRIRNSEAKQIYRSYTDPNDKAKNEELDRRWQKDKSITRLYANKLNVSMEQAKEIKEKYAQKYREYGITDDETIIKVMKLDQRKYGSNLASSDRIAIAKLSKTTTTSKDLNNLRESLEKRAKNENQKIRFYNISEGVKEINDMV